MGAAPAAIWYASELSKAARKAEEWTERRNTLIRDMADQGVSLRGIAKYARLSHTAVAKILAR